MPWCNACCQELGSRAFSKNQLRKVQAAQRCTTCITTGRNIQKHNRDDQIMFVDVHGLTRTAKEGILCLFVTLL
jgi:hypothetical protein